jgi:hypothetical protein
MYCVNTKNRGEHMKKAQLSGTGAAVLILVIAALIIVYILVLPPTERQQLLEGTQDSGVLSVEDKSLLFENPGRIDHSLQKDVEHHIPSFELYSKTDANILKELSSVYIRNAWMDQEAKNFTFLIDDLRNTKNMVMSFNVRKHSGRLTIKLNGEEIFNTEIGTLNLPPIKLPAEYLLEGENRVEMSVSGVGMKFWKTNEYALENLKITAQVTDVSTREARNTFIVSRSERENIERVHLRYFPDCIPERSGILSVYLNNHELSSRPPDCGITNKHEIPPEHLIQGENSLVYRTSKGVYRIQNILVRSELKEVVHPTFYFEVEDEVYDVILTGADDVLLRLEFVDDLETKKADIVVNGHVRDLTQVGKEYELKLNPFIRKGRNAISIKPRTVLDILTLEVVIE